MIRDPRHDFADAARKSIDSLPQEHRSSFRTRQRGAAMGVSLALLVAGCSNDDDASTATTAAPSAASGSSVAPAPKGPTPASGTTKAPNPAPTTATPATTATPDNEPSPPAGDICSSIPSIADISRIAGATFTTATDQSDPTGDPAKCELISDTVVMVTFNQLSDELGSGVLDIVEADGLLVPYSNPALPEAKAYSNLVTVPHNGGYWEVQIVNPVVDINSPKLLEAAGTLLALWIAES
jgi:hypothetical protein